MLIKFGTPCKQDFISCTGFIEEERFSSEQDV